MASERPYDAREGECRFDTFISPVGDVAKATAEAVSRRPGSHNPLLIVGPAGRGKTHLLWAISAEMAAPHLLLDVKAEGPASVRHAALASEGRQHILVDNLHALQDEESIAELQLVLRAAATLGVQVVATSRRRLTSGSPPWDALALLAETRGRVLFLSQPSRETVEAILRQRAHLRGVPMDDSAASYLAGSFPTDLRSALSCLALAETYASTHGRVTLDAMRCLIGEIAGGEGEEVLRELRDRLARELDIETRRLEDDLDSAFTGGDLRLGDG